jgi:hypothetical protein
MNHYLGVTCTEAGVSKTKVAMGGMFLTKVAMLVGMPELEILTVQARFKQHNRLNIKNRMGLCLAFTGCNPCI